MGGIGKAYRQAQRDSPRRRRCSRVPRPAPIRLSHKNAQRQRSSDRLNAPAVASAFSGQIVGGLGPLLVTSGEAHAVVNGAEIYRRSKILSARRRVPCSRRSRCESGAKRPGVDWDFLGAVSVATFAPVHCDGVAKSCSARLLVLKDASTTRNPSPRSLSMPGSCDSRLQGRIIWGLGCDCGTKAGVVGRICRHRLH